MEIIPIVETEGFKMERDSTDGQVTLRYKFRCPCGELHERGEIYSRIPAGFSHVEYLLEECGNRVQIVMPWAEGEKHGD